jgi:3'-phosphoadenosine 5'-phosphosulfate sulfotransferase (PAPS reductase)/FAD synthetase
MASKRLRHILGLSGGKDSAALAIYMRDRIPDIEYFFCDTHKELPETYEFLDKLEARLGKRIVRLSSERGFDHWLSVYNGFLPSAKSRWCTKKLKIEPIEQFVGEDETVSYVALRADEDRIGYISTKENIEPIYPFKDNGLTIEDVLRILDESGIGLPQYYKWRSRSGCYFCFFQRKYEWIMLSEFHPRLFDQAVKYETLHSDSRSYCWNDNEPLRELLRRKDEIIAQYERTLLRKTLTRPNRPLVEIELVAEDLQGGFIPFLDDRDVSKRCSVCHVYQKKCAETMTTTEIG